MIKNFFVTFSLVLAFTGIQAQTKTEWKNKKCAVSLTYDDALNVHLDNAVPLLDSLGFKGTFYLSVYFPGFRDRMPDWKKASQRGHELANHTLFHPCIGNMPGREWVNPERDLSKYTVQRMTDEMRMTNIVLQSIDGKTKHTFAYPCGDTKIGDSSYIDKKDFVAARGTKAEMLHIAQIDLYNVGCYPINGESGDQLIQLVKQAMESGTLLVFLFHGVGGEHNLNVSLEAHRALLKFLKANEKDIWVAPFIEIAEHIKKGNYTN